MATQVQSTDAAKRSKQEIYAGLSIGGIVLLVAGLLALTAFNHKVHISDKVAEHIQDYTVLGGLLALPVAIAFVHHKVARRKMVAARALPDLRMGNKEKAAVIFMVVASIAVAVTCILAYSVPQFKGALRRELFRVSHMKINPGTIMVYLFAPILGIEFATILAAVRRKHPIQKGLL